MANVYSSMKKPKAFQEDDFVVKAGENKKH